ncbi:phospholipid-translocating P-type ATPase [Neocallimastix lanati (nom. inval.)]|jgi:phospholipid-translocating ATPase|uniref:Phospholipid-transporting ATPase n=1 Tax=Neocallimastix californiae TaxID=1754190 RepID=A0A1Y2AY62_9FUNG|nr:phospholipid-translocating P-type ATPase [Neocallimastix sp. JGI-2020a]ORY26825.1 phospholipid-translocating P-type ATPase [Neocallimastix californiae]|eukprot:ORY26825.1 phospholipid-translocating P-type ATPase [Neocallimastix californiae]
MGLLRRATTEFSIRSHTENSEFFSSKDGAEGKRRIFINIPMEIPWIKSNGLPRVQFPNNRIFTSHYTWYNFIPKNLFEQFRSVANFYFLILVILQLLPQFQYGSSPITTAAPMLFIVGVTALRAGFEDYKRHETDHKRNWMKTIKLGGWKNQNYIIQSQSKLKLLYQKIVAKLSFRPYHEDDNIEDNTASEIPLMELNEEFSSSEHIKSRSSSFNKSTTSLNSMKSNRHSIKNEIPKWIGTTWQDLHVGDFVLLRENDLIPADILVISTSEQDNLCYIETKNLDGETNLKVRQGIKEFGGIKKTNDLASIKCYLDADAPNNNLYTFKGVLHMVDQDTGEETQNLCTINSMLLRDCILKNTEWVIGLVVYTGFHTKSILNTGDSPSKRSKIEKQLNPQVLLNFLILAIMCIVCAVTHYLYTASFKSENAQFWTGDDNSDGNESPIIAAIKTFINSLILYQNIIPIALYVSVEISKTLHAFFIYSDEEIYDEELEKPTLARSWNLSDDLGQIEYIFSDKTGTLTRNVMNFRKCTINGVLYGDAYVTEAQMGQNKANNVAVNADDSEKQFEDEMVEMHKLMKSVFNPIYVTDKPTFADANLYKDIIEDGDQASFIKEFFILLATCNTVLTEVKKDEDEVNSKEEDEDPLHNIDESLMSEDSHDAKLLSYRAQSPDEGALVEGARNLGFTLIGRNQSKLMLDVLGEQQTYEALQVIEFDSDRKRMSVIFRTPDNQIIIFCKGADSVIFERLAAGQDKIKEVTLDHLQRFASEGLRTLCLGYRVLNEEEFMDWHKRYKEASLLDSEEAQQQIALLNDEVENNFILIGASAIEDKLQDGVPECIETLSKAGIKIWVLTGDKLETAINIGFACNLLNHNMQIIVIRGDDEEDTYNQLVKALSSFWAEDGTDISGNPYSLVIDGQSLKHALGRRSKALLLELSCRCKAVICCRVSPLQKAKVVSLVKKGLGAMCLAVGDGANDISMIQEADIGVGISGKEGAQAVMSADYAIGQFRFLTRLLLVHGRWAYMRTANLILTYFYKNVVWLFVLFWFQFNCGFSAAVLFDYNYTLFFTTVFTLLLNMNMGIFDQDINDRIAIAIPQLYSIGISGSLYTMQKFWVHIAYGIYESLIAFFFGYFIYREATTSPDGYDSGQEVMGNCVAFLLIISINIVMAFNTYSWTIITFGSLILTLAVWIGFVFYYSSYSSSLTYGIISRLFGEPAFYLITPVYFVLALAPRYIKKYIQVTHFPTDVDIIHEVNKYRIRIPDLPENYEFDDETYREKKKKKEKKREERRRARDLYWKKQKENFQKMVNILTPQSKTGDVKATYTSTNGTNNGSKYQFSTTEGGENGSVPIIKVNPSNLLNPNDDASSQHSTATRKTKLFPSNVRTPTFSSIHSSNSNSNAGVDTGTDGAGNEDELENAIQTPQQKYIYNILKNQAIMKVLNSHFPKLKVKDYIHTANKRRPSNAGIVYMNDEKIVSNTGFCYSQESGMKEIITPSGNENILPSYETMRGGERTEWDNSIPKYKNFRRTRSLNDSYSRSRPEKLETRRYRTYQNNIFSKSVDNFEYHRRLQQHNSLKSPSDTEGFFNGNSNNNNNKNSIRKSKGKSSEY